MKYIHVLRISNVFILFVAAALAYFLLKSCPYVFVINMETNNNHDTYQIFWDKGEGFSESNSAKTSYIKKDKNTIISLPFSIDSTNSIRIDPGTSTEEIKIRSFAIQLKLFEMFHTPSFFSWKGQTLLHAFQATNDIAVFALDNSGEVSIQPSGHDPSIQYRGDFLALHAHLNHLLIIYFAVLTIIFICILTCCKWVVQRYILKKVTLEKSNLSILFVAIVLAIIFLKSCPYVFVINLETKNNHDTYQIFWDKGAGFNETDSTKTSYLKKEADLVLALPLQLDNTKSIRIDPGTSTEEIKISSFEIRLRLCKIFFTPSLYSWRGQDLLDDFQATNDIAIWALDDSGKLSIRPSGDDPSLQYVSDFVANRLHINLLFVVFLIVLVIVFVCIGALCKWVVRLFLLKGCTSIVKLEYVRFIFVNFVFFLAIIGLFVVIPPIVYHTLLLVHGGVKKNPEFPLLKRYPWYCEFSRELAMLKTEYVDFAVWRGIKMSGKAITIDENGLRKTIQPECIKDTSVRILFMGASIIWGYGSPDSLTVPSQFAAITSLETVNYGQNGYGSRQNLACLANYYIEKKQEKKINIIILNDGIIDPYFFCHDTGKEISSNRQDYIRWALEEVSSSVDEKFSYLYFLKPAIDLKNLDMPYIPEKAVAPEWTCASASSERAAYIAEKIVRAWIVAAKLAVSNGDKLFVVFPPTMAVGSPYLGSLPKMDSDMALSIKNVYLLIKEKVKAYPELNFIDLTEIFNVDKQIYIDDVHYSPEGNRIYAEALVKELRQYQDVKKYLNE